MGKCGANQHCRTAQSLTLQLFAVGKIDGFADYGNPNMEACLEAAPEMRRNQGPWEHGTLLREAVWSERFPDSAIPESHSASRWCPVSPKAPAMSKHDWSLPARPGLEIEDVSCRVIFDVISYTQEGHDHPCSLGSDGARCCRTTKLPARV